MEEIHGDIARCGKGTHGRVKPVSGKIMVYGPFHYAPWTLRGYLQSRDMEASQEPDKGEHKEQAALIHFHWVPPLI
jgi:hypothetical protein